MCLQGMQRNPGYPSIEGELEKAICKAGGISEANAESFTKVNSALQQSEHCCMPSCMYFVVVHITIACMALGHSMDS